MTKEKQNEPSKKQDNNEPLFGIVEARIVIPKEFLKLKRKQVISEIETPEKTMDLGNGAELILEEGTITQLVKETYVIQTPDLSQPQLKSGKKLRRKK